MIDFARNPVGRQAVRLSSTEVFTRKVCYFFARLGSLPRFVLVLLKQKGNPELNA